jgi:hypothetical protein
VLICAIGFYKRGKKFIYFEESKLGKVQLTLRASQAKFKCKKSQVAVKEVQI